MIENKTPICWEEEKVFFEGDAFFDHIFDHIRSAKTSIDIEMYIFESDGLGREVGELLKKAHDRGVKVRVLVDGIGSLGWNHGLGYELKKYGVENRIFHVTPWDGILESIHWPQRLARAIAFFNRINKRTHRKIVVIDNTYAWIGGRNFASIQSERYSGKNTWRDTSAYVRGPMVEALSLSFEENWKRATENRIKRLKRRFLKRKEIQYELVRLNSTREQRKNLYFELLEKIIKSQKHIYIISAYFVPHGSLIKALRMAAWMGVEVQIIVPKKSDIWFMPYVCSALYYGLISAGVRIFEYQPRVLHAKTVLVDNWLFIGSTNLNHRSLYHDLEVDVVLKSPQSINEVKEQFALDLKQSEEILMQDWLKYTFSQRWIGRIFLFFRYWL